MNEDKAARYRRRRSSLALLVAAVSAGTLLALVVSPAAVAIRTLAADLAAEPGDGTGPLTWAMTALAVGLVLELATLLPRYRREHLLERRYGLSHAAASRWWRQHALSTAIALLTAAGAAAGIAWCMAVAPALWWVAVGALWALGSLAMAAAAPRLLFPLIWPATPLADRPLVERLQALAARAGVRHLDVRAWHLGRDSKRANAALVGLGPAQQILLSDTLLENYSPDEIEVILAHELGHHAHADLWADFAYDGVVRLSALAAGASALSRAWGALGSSGPHDAAALPLLILVIGAVTRAFEPLGHVWSRRRERRADRFALDLTGNPGAFSSALKRLGAQNLADARPPVLSRWLGSHPPLAERLALASRWSAGSVRTGPRPTRPEADVSSGRATRNGGA